MHCLNFIFWHIILSEHQSALTKALAEYPDINVYFAYENSAQRGWSVPDFGQAKVVDVRVPENYAMLVAMGSPQDIHFLSGYFSFPIAWRAFHSLRRSQARLYILSEAFNFLGVTGWLRLQRARYQRLIWGNAFDAVLAMGELGTSFYRMAGFPADKVYEFAYFVDSPSLGNSSLKPHPSPDQPFKLLFVGQLIHRKGLDLLLQALSQLSLSADQLQLDIIGVGSLRPSLEKLAQTLGLSKQVRFLGGQPNQATLAAMQNADLLVLPSRWDGWGAVISEALMVGTPVLCSDRCGASTLVTASGCGEVFSSKDVVDLVDKLQAQLQKGPVSLTQRNHLKDWANCLGPDRAAAYILQLINTLTDHQLTEKPYPPWHA
jgi:glycosyltransferase involved in cell wall biosynthesis